MNNKAFSLQLLSHKQIFETRDEAKTYFEDNFKPFSLVGEPAVAFYGDSKSPKAMIAIGTADKKIFFIDIDELSERISSLEEGSEKDADDIKDSLVLIKDIVESCGLTFDENKKEHRITYEVDKKDPVIGDVSTVAEAVNTLSKFIQKNFKDNNLSVKDTDTVALNCIENEKGKEISADVKISADGDSDHENFNDNIICQRRDGLYAAANIEYDKEKRQLTFTSSGYRDGKYMHDANRKEISLGEHTSITKDNEGHNINIVVNKDGDSHFVLSGDVNISENSNNIIKIENNSLFVDGSANNIKYGESNVEKSLNEINKQIQGIEVKVDPITNRLTLSVGGKEQTVELPGVQIIKDITYDKEHGTLNISFKDNSTVSIDIKDTIEIIDVENKPTSAVELHKRNESSPSSNSLLSADVKIRTNDNLLSKDNNGNLYVPTSTLTEAVASERERAMKEAEELRKSIEQNSKDIVSETKRSQEEEGKLYTKFGTLDAELKDEKARATAKETELTNSIQDEAAKNDALAEQLKTISEKTATNNKLITDETERSKNAEQEIERRLTDEINTKVHEVTVEKNSTSDLQYTLLVDGKPSGEINIPKDQFLSNVEYLTGDKIIRFTFETTTGSKITDVNVADLVDTYVAGDGLSLADNKFSVKKSDGSQNYIEVTADGIKVVRIDEALAQKADADKVYTKEQIDAKGYLTEHQDLSEVNSKVDGLQDTATKLENQINVDRSNFTNYKKSNDSEVEQLKTKDDNFSKQLEKVTKDLSFVTNNTNTVRLSKVTSDDGVSTLKADAEISTFNGNLIKADQPLFASVDLSYDAGTNRLTLYSSALAEPKVIQLSIGSIINDIEYDGANEKIILKYRNGEGKDAEVSLSARELFNQWNVQHNHLGGVILKKEVNKDGGGIDVLSAEVVISTLSSNGLINDNGSLYVSKQAKDYLLDDKTTVQSAIEELQKKVDAGSDNTELNDRLTKCELQVNSLAGNDVKQDAKLATLEKDVENLKNKPSLKVASTNSVTMAVNEDTITSEIRLASVDNLIRVNEDGLSFDGSIDYGTY